MEGLNRKIRDFSVVLRFVFSESFWEKRREKKTRTMKRSRGRQRKSVIWPLQLDEKRRIRVSFQAINSITSTRIIKNGVFDYSLYQGFEDNLGAHTPIIQESENRQKDCGLELIKTVRVEECGICITRSNSKSL